MSFTEITIAWGGELSQDVSATIATKISQEIPSLSTSVTPLSKLKPKTLPSLPPTTLLIVILQTIENQEPSEDAGAFVRFFKRKTHPSDLLTSGFHLSMLGLGDSNLLLDRQTTGSKDCNDVAFKTWKRMGELGIKNFGELGVADERTGLTEVEVWIEGLVELLKEKMA
ncbi:hypothetical protein TrVE_jg12305 [Triparma verrucosa]|uniref:Flavodoxin-like domain-containing protein n=1 Tax=Triparma verrucosa TaxID=1606542 RepID=A0A9W7BSP1_9STRA|nr:hypothetical protein TrVE_jg12305 [Triparma verrucosa]